MTQRIPVVEKILSANDHLAAENRQRLDFAGLFSMNFMASPGAGKTSLVERTVQALSGKLRIAMINGDIATSLDAQRASAAGAQAIQINTGGECHLDAVMLKGALTQLDLPAFDLSDRGKCWQPGLSGQFFTGYTPQHSDRLHP